jgi:iron(III) transport system substrate-binding protein
VTALLALLGPGCRDRGEPEPKPADKLVVYCSIDEVFGRMVLDRFRTRTGIEVVVTFDSEAGKTTGLVNKIIAESQAGRPRADVFWSSELFNTIRLARMGLLVPYDPPTAADIPARYKDPGHRWTALAARARVIAYDPKRLDQADVPKRWADLAEPAFAERTAIANPLFGTTRGHVAAMFALWSESEGKIFLTKLREGGVQLADGNSATVRAVIAGRAEFALTDTDDVWVAQRSGASLDLVYPDMGDGGTLMIPCSVAMIKGRPDNEAARKLVDFLVSAEVERLLAESDSRNVPVRDGLCQALKIARPAESKVSFDAIADAMDGAVKAAREILLR